MKKTFETPIFEIVWLSMQDVMFASSGDGDNFPWDEDTDLGGWE